MVMTGEPVPWEDVVLAIWLVVTIAPRPAANLFGALVRGIGFVVHLPAWLAGEIRSGCLAIVERAAIWEETQLGLSRSSTGLMVTIVRLFYGVLAADVVLSTVYLDLMRVGAVLFGPEAGSVSLPVTLSIPLVTGLLTFAVVAMIGMALLDVLGAVPPSVALYPNPSPRFRRLLAWTASIGSALALAMVVLLFVAGQLIALGYEWPLASLLVSALQGALANVTAVMAFWALVLGVVALIALLLRAVAGLCRLGSLPFELAQALLAHIADEIIPHLVDILSAPARWLWNWARTLPLVRALRLPRLRGLYEAESSPPPVDDPEHGLVAPPSAAAEAGDVGTDGGRWPSTRLAPAGAAAGETDEDDLKVNGKRSRSKAALVFVDAFGYGLMEPLGNSLVRLGGGRGKLVRMSGYVPLTRLPDGSARRLAHTLGAHDVTSTPAQVERAHRTGEAHVRL